MAKKKSGIATGKDSAANLGFEARLWLAANKFRSNLGAVVPHMFGEHGLFSHNICRVRALANSPVTPIHLCYPLNSSEMYDTVSGYGNGTTVNMLPLHGFRFPQFPLPSTEPHSEAPRIWSVGFWKSRACDI